MYARANIRIHIYICVVCIIFGTQFLTVAFYIPVKLALFFISCFVAFAFSRVVVLFSYITIYIYLYIDRYNAHTDSESIVVIKQQFIAFFLLHI